MVSLNTPFVATFVVVLAVGLVPSIAAVPSDHATKGDETVIPSSVRIGEAYNSGIFMVCHSYPNPSSSSKLYFSKEFEIDYRVQADESCARTGVSGTVGAKTELNHRLVPDDDYTGLNYFYEDAYSCPPGAEVRILRHSPQNPKGEIVFSCKAPSKARVVWYGMNLFN